MAGTKVTFRSLVVELPEDTMLRVVKQAAVERLTVHEFVAATLTKAIDA